MRGRGTISKDNLKDNEAQLEQPIQKLLEEDIDKGRKQKQEIDYYEKDHSTPIDSVTKKFGDQKKPAISGLVVVLPIIAVFLLVGWFFQKINLIPGHEVLNLTSIYVINQSLKLGAILIMGAAIITLAGKLVKTNRGFQAERALDRVFSSIPILGIVYRITKVTAETVTGSDKGLRRPVKIKIQGMRVTAFKTGNKTRDGKEIIFLPTAPNITTGFILEAESDDLIETKETAEEALTRTLSAGFGQYNRTTE